VNPNWQLFSTHLAAGAKFPANNSKQRNVNYVADKVNDDEM